MATIVDVAKKARVSVSTVSYAMSGARPISEATRQRIMEAIDELGYHPNKLARGLASKRTKVIALLYPTVVSGYLDDIQLEFISSVANITSHYNYGMLLFTSPSGEREISRFINESLIDGLILMEVQIQDPRVALMKQLKYPFSLIGHCEDNEGCSFVDMDFYAGLRLCVQHLAERGHREIAFIHSAKEAANISCTYIHESLRGFQNTARELGITGIIAGSSSSTEDASAVTRQLLEEHPAITAMIAGNDPIYSGVMQCLEEKRLAIPRDISTIGIISHQMAEKYTPKVTSLTIPSSEMGRLGAEFLIRRLEGLETEPQQTILAPKLTIRHSTDYRSNGSGG